MLTLTKSALSVAVLSATVFAATGAGAWDRHTSVTGPDGKTVSSHASGSCHDNECRSKQVVVGPNGRTLVRRGIARCHGDECEGTVRVTGPEGRTVTRRIKVER